MSKIKFLLFLFLLGIVLYYWGKPEPFRSLKTDFSKILGNSSQKEKEPWTREGRGDTVASDNGSLQSKIEDAVSDKKKEVTESIFDAFKRTVTGDDKAKDSQSTTSTDLDKYIPSSKTNTEIVCKKYCS